MMSSNNESYLTVVFKITDKQKFKSTSDSIFAAFSGESSLEGATVTGVSLEDEMTNCEKLQEQLDQLNGNMGLKAQTDDEYYNN